MLSQIKAFLDTRENINKSLSDWEGCKKRFKKPRRLFNPKSLTLVEFTFAKAKEWNEYGRNERSFESDDAWVYVERVLHEACSQPGEMRHICYIN